MPYFIAKPRHCRCPFANCRHCIFETPKIEWYDMLQHPRQSCEDVVCSHCLEADDFRQCKQKCIQDENERIQECCSERCSGLPQEAHSYCISGCEPLNFGQTF